MHGSFSTYYKSTIKRALRPIKRQVPAYIRSKLKVVQDKAQIDPKVDEPMKSALKHATSSKSVMDSKVPTPSLKVTFND